jgi:dTDP-4-dehydrorhamnose 3,5-epimerase
MKAQKTVFQTALIIDPDVFRDKRGYFMETYHREKYEEFGISEHFVQDNLSYSVRGTLRGLHYQHPHGQVKLVQVIRGEIFDVIVDIRQGSPTFGWWTSVRLSDENGCQFYIPEGFAHGFCVLSETALVSYKCSDFYAPESEGGIIWSDPALNISWPVKNPLISDKDSRYPFLKDLSVDRLPVYEEKP